MIKVSAPDAAAVTITLSSAVSWQLDLGGGTTRTIADLRGGQLAVAVTAGSDVIELTLPRRSGIKKRRPAGRG